MLAWSELQSGLEIVWTWLMGAILPICACPCGTERVDKAAHHYCHCTVCGREWNLLQEAPPHNGVCHGQQVSDGRSSMTIPAVAAAPTKRSFPAPTQEDLDLEEAIRLSMLEEAIREGR